MQSTAQQKIDQFDDKRKKDGYLQSFACMFAAVNLNSLAVLTFGDNLNDIAEHFAQAQPLLDYGWVTVSAYSLTTLAGCFATSLGLGWEFGQKLTDMNYQDKKIALDISLLGENYTPRP